MDFAKYAPKQDIPKFSLIWNSIPAQLAKENGKFIYGLLKKGAGARAFENAITWLNNAGMVYIVKKIEKPAMPLKAYVSTTHFKLYSSDIGLLRKMSGLSARSILQEDRLYSEFKGAITENYVLQEQVMQLDETPFYCRGKYDPPVSIKAAMLDLNENEGILNIPLYLMWKLSDFS